MGKLTFSEIINQFNLIVLLILFTKYGIIQCDKTFMMSHSSISSLALNEESIYESLKSHYSSYEDGQLKQEQAVRINRYLADYEDSTGKVRTPGKNILSQTQYGNVIADHPLLSFRLIYRFVNDLTTMILKHSDLNEILQQSCIRIKASIGWPVISDVKNSVNAILRIHHVYDANLTEFARGNIFGSNTGYGLPAKLSYEIGNYAINQRYFAYAVEWLEFAKLLIDKENDTTIDGDLVTTRLAEAIETHDLKFETNELDEPLFFSNKLQNLDPSLPRLKRRTHLAMKWKGRRELNYNTINFCSLCSGEDLRTEEEKSELYCWYERKTNLAWIISPLKIEQLAHTPFLVQIYEVLTDTLIDKIIQRAESNLKIAGVFTGNENDKMTRDRTSLSSWLADRVGSELQTIPTRIELITGLSVLPKSSSEKLQIATYTFGGHYGVHLDALRNETGYWATLRGDRIATFMIYLSDVEKGGYTVFPQAGIAARPVKNSGVFWFNLLANGEVDGNSRHGACPVILGSKWVANKWIRSNDQFLAVPCSLDPEE